MIRAGFLDPESRRDLIELARDGSAAHRLARRANALVLLDQGMSCSEVAKVLLLDDDTVRTWYRLYEEEGFEGLASFGYDGSACRLSDQQQDRLKAWITETLPQTTGAVGAWIEKEYGIVYESRSGLVALLHRLGMEHRKPKAVSSKLDPGKQAAFIKKYENLLNSIGDDEAVLTIDLITMSRQLDQVVGAEVEAASQAMQASFEKLVDTATERQRAAASTAVAAGHQASTNIMTMVGVIALLMVSSGSVITRMLAGPMRRLTVIVQAIASGKTDQAVPYTEWRDEIGRMAASVETLRAVMRQTFIQSQMIEQLPVGVMTAEPAGDFRITYLNAEGRAILETVRESLGVPVEKLVGHTIDVFPLGAHRPRDMAADPANLPHHARLTLGSETLDLRISATFDRNGAYAGPLLTWRSVTGQAHLVQQFEQSIGGIARTVAESADGMRHAAAVMRDSAIVAGERTLAVSAASDQASQSVSTAATGAEEVAISVAEIARQVAESAQIAGIAVAEAQATDASVGKLSEAADRISAVVRLIGDIAARTNLLALNATIEAARAGEAGKGFAVVAGEVKSLATQTAKATQDIGGQITAMQQATAQAVTALRSISATIQRMNEIATIIAGSVEEQGAATQSIAQAVQQAAAGTAEVNTNIAAVTQVVDETGSRAGGVLEAATEMTGQAAMLKDEVAKFLVAVQRAA